MTIIGGKVAEGKGFFAICVNCGRHDGIEVRPAKRFLSEEQKWWNTKDIVELKCRKCGQVVEHEDITDR